MTESESLPTHNRSSLITDYDLKTSLYRDVMGAALSILNRTLPGKVVVATTHRIKDFDSFYEKANRTEEKKLKYPDPFEQIVDIVGLRVVVIAQRNISDVCLAIRSSLEVIEEQDKAAELLAAGQLGYESYHLICRLGDSRSHLQEYSNLCGQSFEIQVRTALQHAWAENEHRIQYKKTKNPELQKRFLRLSAAMSSADEEFDRIYEINEQLQSNIDAASKESAASDEFFPLTDSFSDSAEDNNSLLSKISLQFGKKPSELSAEGRHEEAVQVYDRFIESQPNQVGHYVGRAKARAMAGYIDAGLTDLGTARRIAPDHPATKSLEKFFERLLRNIEGTHQST